jgi:hypothetical protein
MSEKLFEELRGVCEGHSTDDIVDACAGMLIGAVIIGVDGNLDRAARDITTITEKMRAIFPSKAPTHASARR